MTAQLTESQLGLERIYGAMRNLNDLELSDFRGVIMGMLSATLREPILTLNYHRAAINIGQLLITKDTKQFEAISMLARTIFELAVEIKLMSITADAASKIDVFTGVEKLRAARKMVAFKKAHPEARFQYETQEKFVAACGAVIDDEQAAMWPGRDEVKHWTLKSLAKRAEELGAPFERIYEVHYPQLSWDAHSGVVSVFQATPNSFVPSVGIAYTIAVESYMQILEILVNEFKLYTTNPLLKNKIAYMKNVAYAESQDEADRIRYAYGV